MDKNEIYLKTEVNDNNIKKKRRFSSTMPNLKRKSQKKSYTLNYSKLKFDQNVLINILKKSNLKRNKTLRNNNSKYNSIPYKTTIIKNGFKISYNINRKLHDLPVMSRFHNITGEKITDLLKSDHNLYETLKPYKIKNINRKINEKRNKTEFFNKNFSKKNNNRIQTFLNLRYQNENNKNNNRKYQFNSLNKDSKNTKLSLNEISTNYTQSISNLKNRNHYNNNNTSSSFTKSEKKNTHTIPNIKKIKLNKTNNKFRSNTSEKEKWMSYIKESLKSMKLFNRGSKIDRLIFFIENPYECFEENLLDKKPGDKYQMFKNQITKHKNKLDKILKEIKLNQIKSEYLMKKYIFDLLSRKKKIY